MKWEEYLRNMETSENCSQSTLDCCYCPMANDYKSIANTAEPILTSHLLPMFRVKGLHVIQTKLVIHLNESDNSHLLSGVSCMGGCPEACICSVVFFA